MKNKKIDVVVKYFYPVAAGIEVNTLETYSELVKKGWDVTFHVSSDTYLKKNVLPKYEIVKGIKVKRYRFKSDFIGFTPDINWDKVGVVCLHNFNIFYFRILIKSFFLKLFSKKSFSLVITPHGGFNPEWRVFSKFQRIFKFIYHHTFGVLLINLVADGVRAVSEWEKNEMIKNGIKKSLVTIITNGLEDEAFMDVDKLASKDIKEKVKQFGLYIIQVGRIYKIKNYETVIKALPYVDKRINYVIVGQEEKGTDYKKYLMKLAIDLGVSNRVRFVGVVRGADKYYLMNKAKLMVHMAMWESFCNVVHEGLSQGLICVVANNTALPLLVKDNINGYTIDTLDFMALSKKINYVFKNYKSSKLKKMRDLNKKIGENDSWKNVASNVSKYYLELESRQ